MSSKTTLFTLQLHRLLFSGEFASFPFMIRLINGPWFALNKLYPGDSSRAWAPARQVFGVGGG